MASKNYTKTFDDSEVEFSEYDASYTVNGRFKSREYERHMETGVIERGKEGDTLKSGQTTESFTGDLIRRLVFKGRCIPSEQESSLETIQTRGYVVIIINHEFNGTAKDLPLGNEIKEIKTLFPKYGYEARGFTNLSASAIGQKIKWYANKPGSHSLVCFISSHGNRTSILGSDGEKITLAEIFKAANSPVLEDKPKTFFFDACRSNVGEDVKEDLIPELPSSEFFVGFSCLGSEISRAYGNCGYYIEALISVFKKHFPLPQKEHGKRRDIEYLVKKANFLVHNQRDESGKKLQLPEFKSSLAGVYFLQGGM